MIDITVDTVWGTLGVGCHEDAFVSVPGLGTNHEIHLEGMPESEHIAGLFERPGVLRIVRDNPYGMAIEAIRIPIRITATRREAPCTQPPSL